MLYISQLAFTILTAPIPSNELQIYTNYLQQTTKLTYTGPVCVRGHIIFI